MRTVDDDDDDDDAVDRSGGAGLDAFHHLNQKEIKDSRHKTRRKK